MFTKQCVPGPLSTIYYLVHSYDISGLTCEHSPARLQSAVLRTLTGRWSPGNLAANLTADLTGPPQPHAGLLTGHLTTWPSLAAGLGACLCVVFSLSRLHLSPDCGGAAAGAAASNTQVRKLRRLLCLGCGSDAYTELWDQMLAAAPR